MDGVSGVHGGTSESGVDECTNIIKKKKKRKKKLTNSRPLRIRHRLPHPSCKLPEVLIGDSVAQKNYKNYEVGNSEISNKTTGSRK